ncbi:MAG: hypothetical protein MZV63_06040 [Marinilabiliales bacterium]|nr:hypothetical protein [Marinilabiliales bacterium]
MIGTARRMTGVELILALRSSAMPAHTANPWMPRPRGSRSGRTVAERRSGCQPADGGGIPGPWAVQGRRPAACSTPRYSSALRAVGYRLT